MPNIDTKQIFAVLDDQREIEKAKEYVRELKFTIKECIKQVKEETKLKIKELGHKLKHIIGEEALNKLKWAVKKTKGR